MVAVEEVPTLFPLACNVGRANGLEGDIELFGGFPEKDGDQVAGRRSSRPQSFVTSHQNEYIELMKTDNNLVQLFINYGIRKNASIRTRNEIVDTLHATRYLDQ